MALMDQLDTIETWNLSIKVSLTNIDEFLADDLKTTLLVGRFLLMVGLDHQFLLEAARLYVRPSVQTPCEIIE